MQAAGPAVAFENLLAEFERTDDQMFAVADHSLHVKSKFVETCQFQGAARRGRETSAFIPLPSYRQVA